MVGGLDMSMTRPDCKHRIAGLTSLRLGCLRR